MEGASTSASVHDSRLCGGCYLDVSQFIELMLLWPLLFYFLVDNDVWSSEVMCNSCTTVVELAEDSEYFHCQWSDRTCVCKKYRKQPFLACAKGKFREFLLHRVPVLQEKFWPTIWCFESRLQTVLAGFLRSTALRHVAYKRELFQLSDGGEVALDWLENDCSYDAPIIIILPGLTGTSQADYVKCLAVAASRIGIRTVVFNYRGLGGVTLKTPRTYCACNSEDFEEVLNYVRTCNPSVKIGATGISMGGLVLGNFLALQQKKARNSLSSAMLISVPWNVFKGIESIEKPILNLILNNYLASGLCKLGKRVTLVSSLKQWDENVFQSRTIREFDSKFTVKQFGFKDVQDYYQHATLHNKLHLIQIPVLCLNAADDPFQPFEAIPIEEANKSETVAIMVTARGGHIGFLEGFFPLYSDQYISKVFGQFFKAALKENCDLLSKS